MKLKTESALSSFLNALWIHQNEKYEMKFCADNGQNVIAVRNLMISCHNYQYILGKVGITKSKKTRRVMVFLHKML